MAAHRGGLVGRVDRTVTLLAGHVVTTDVAVGTDLAPAVTTVVGTGGVG